MPRQAVPGRRLFSRASVTAVTLALVAAGCVGPTVDSTTSTPSSSTTVVAPPTTRAPGQERHLVSPDPVEWHDEAGPTDEQLRTIVANLEELEAWALWPPGPPRDPEGDLSARFSVGRWEPTGEVGVGLSMAPPADWRITWRSGDPGPSICDDGTTPLEVRGLQGCTDHPDGEDGLTVGWTEDGYTMSIEVQGLTLDETLRWLDDWSRLPESYR
jgi:hypothetical protein